MSKLLIRLSVAMTAIAFVAVVAAGVAPIAPSPVAIVLASDCQPANDTCTQNDTTKTSVLTVSHSDPTFAGGPLVEPNTGENWDIRAEWRSASGGGACTNGFETATCRVTWNGSGWSLSNVNLTTNIVAISVCDAGSCTGAGGTHGYAYKLYVDITDPISAGPTLNLYQTRYQTTSIDNGRIITSSGTSTCTGIGSTVSPTS